MSEFDNGNMKWLTAKYAPHPELFQYIPLHLESVSDASTLEPGDAKTTKISYTMKLSVPNAYLPYKFATNRTLVTADTVESIIEIVAPPPSATPDEINAALESEPTPDEFEYSLTSVST